jgi:hypothetical protein
MVAVVCSCTSDRYRAPEAMPGVGVGNAPPAIPLNEAQTLDHAATQPVTPPVGEGWITMFDGQTLKGWRPTDYGSTNLVQARKGLIYLAEGKPFNGVNWTNETPKVGYEIALDTMRTSGSDFFCGLTFPVRDAFCSLIVGGWGGSIVGISSVDGADASENETTQYINFETGKWYRIRLRVTTEKIEAWVEQKKVVNLTTTGRKLSLRFGDIELSKPFGIACWGTGAAYREIKIRKITTPDSAAEKE